MQFSSFNYTKKNGENKNYFILKMEDGPQYIEGIVLNNLEEKEVEELVSKYFDYEVEQRRLEKLASDEGKTIEEFLEENQELKEEYDNKYIEIKPYIKKAYRKFIASNVKDPSLDEKGIEDLKGKINADFLSDKE